MAHRDDDSGQYRCCSRKHRIALRQPVLGHRTARVGVSHTLPPGISQSAHAPGNVIAGELHRRWRLAESAGRSELDLSVGEALRIGVGRAESHRLQLPAAAASESQERGGDRKCKEPEQERPRRCHETSDNR